MISVVTPWRIVLWARPSVRRDSVDHESMLMKPGATARPVASMMVAPGAAEIADRAIRSRSPTSAFSPAAPVPSYTSPLRMTTSN